MLGIIGTIIALINVCYAIAVYENFAMVDHNFVLEAIIGNAPEHIIRLTYVVISIFDLVASALLIAGILMVNIKRKQIVKFIGYTLHRIEMANRMDSQNKWQPTE